MANLGEILVYLFWKYPNPNELSKARVVKMIYLSDWRSAIISGKQITSINWIYNHYGPYVNDIIDYIRQDNRFEITSTTNYWGEFKEVISLKKQNISVSLNKETTDILDFVIEGTSKLYWNDFIKLVYSTYPIKNSVKYTELNLVDLADEYKKNTTPNKV